MVQQRENYKVVVSQAALDRIANDQCPSCGLPRTQWKRSPRWRCCSKECTELYWKEGVLAFGWQDLRRKAFERDGYKCVKCGAQPICEVQYSTPWDAKVLRTDVRHGITVFTIVKDLVGDHIKAIALGGEEWAISNIQTLCAACNKAKTAEDAAKIARLRLQEKARVKNKAVEDFL